MYEDIIESAAKQFHVDTNLIKSIIMVESSWKPNATRYEKKLDDSSYGLMQLLSKTAKWISGNDEITGTQLKQPTLNILLGTKYLRYLWDKYKDEEAVIASYNAGKPIRSKLTNNYINQHYVDKVTKVLRSYRRTPTTIAFAIAGAIGGLVWINKGSH